MDEDDDMLTAMARELVTNQRVGEQVAEVWKLCRMRHSAVQSIFSLASRRPDTPRVAARLTAATVG